MVDLENLTNSSEVSLPDLEKKVLDFWQLNNAFETSIRKSAKPYIFYDGPPFATGLPHHGHLLASTIKVADDSRHSTQPDPRSSLTSGPCSNSFHSSVELVLS
jgi:hypothetical protein